MYVKNAVYNKDAWIKRGWTAFFKTYFSHLFYSRLNENARRVQLKKDWKELTGLEVGDNENETKPKAKKANKE